MVNGCFTVYIECKISKVVGFTVDKDNVEMVIISLVQVTNLSCVTCRLNSI